MTREDVIRTLKSCRVDERRERKLMEDRDRLLAKLYRVASPTFSAAPSKGEPAVSQEELIDAKDRVEAAYAALIHEVVQNRINANAMLSILQDGEQKRVLEALYIERCPVWIVAREIGCSEKTCRRIREAAFSKLEKVDHF